MRLVPPGACTQIAGLEPFSKKFANDESVTEKRSAELGTLTESYAKLGKEGDQSSGTNCRGNF
jgi:hypothetical protein